MSTKEAESSIVVLKVELAKLDTIDPCADELRLQVGHLREEATLQSDTWDTVYLVHYPKCPKAVDYVRVLFPDSMELHGDCYYGDDTTCQGGIATFHGRGVTALVRSEGKTLEEDMQCNFGVLHPEGCRRAIQPAKQAGRFHCLIITLVDTAGAYPGKGAEERRQAEAIAQCLAVFSGIRTPVSTIILNEGGNGGALALSAVSHIMIPGRAIYSVLSPEGFASILRKDESRATETAGVTELTAADLERKGIIDMVIAGPKGSTRIHLDYIVEHLREQLENVLDDSCKKEEKVLLAKRYKKHRAMGVNYGEL